jgi:hypothetical protein
LLAAGVALALLSLSTSRVVAQSAPIYPAWWANQGILSGTMAEDYAAANQGQAKNMAVAAVQELNQDLAQFGGASGTLNALSMTLTATSASTSDYSVLNLGQLKALSQPFYDRLMAVGYFGSPLTSGTYPWIGHTAEDYAMANIGQLKYAFSFDLTYSTAGTGIPDWWVQEYYPSGSTFGGVFGVDPNAIAPMGYGITNLEAYQLGLNPNDPYNGATPSLTVAGGNGQSAGNGIFLANPLVVSVMVSGSAAPPNMPVAFQVGSGGGFLATSPGGPVSSTLYVLTATGGTATAWFACPTSGTGQTTINAFTGVSPRIASVRFTSTTTPPDNSVAAPGGVIARITSEGPVFISWTNNDGGTASHYNIERSTDNQTWYVITSATNTSQCYDMSPPSGGNLYYRVNSIGP